MITKAIFHGFPYSKKPTKFCTFFALVSKMGEIIRMKANNQTNQELI